MTTPNTPTAFAPEKELVTGAYELFRLLENNGIVDHREAHLCLTLCQAYNNALASGGIPDMGFAAEKPLAIMKGLTMATMDANGKPDHAAINQAISVAMGMMNFQFARMMQRNQPAPPTPVQ